MLRVGKGGTCIGLGCLGKKKTKKVHVLRVEKEVTYIGLGCLGKEKAERAYV